MDATLLGTFLSEYPLYKPYKLFEFANPDISPALPWAIRNTTFSYYCDKEGRYTTFHLDVEENLAVKLNRYVPGGGNSTDHLSEYETDDGQLNYTMHFNGECQSCQNYHINFLLHVYSDTPIPVAFPRSSSGRNSVNEGKTKLGEIPAQNGSVYIEKVGINPAVRVKIDKQIEKFLDRESRLWYYKGVKALCENYGIGAFAYFRRIIEKELIHIVKDLASLPSSNSAKISKLVAEHSNNQNPSITSICKDVYEFLPESLKSLNENPLMLLYRQTSEGLHNLTEEQCLDRAELINKIIVFVIRKIHEEKSEILDIRESIKKLKGKY